MGLAASWRFRTALYWYNPAIVHHVLPAYIDASGILREKIPAVVRVSSTKPGNCLLFVWVGHRPTPAQN